MDAASTLRNVRALRLPDAQPCVPDTTPPTMIEVRPETLVIDERYQRNLSERSLRLIRKIVEGWDWRAFKPPVVVQVNDELHVVDGQHTAIAAATHPEIEQIPVMVVAATEMADRAIAFVKHNRDRITATPTQLHYALIEAGDEDAVTISMVCDQVGVRVLKNPAASTSFAAGETVAVKTMHGIMNRRYRIGLRKVLEVCANAKLAPISQAAMLAVESLLFADEFSGEYEPEDITTTLRASFHHLSREGKAFAAQHKLPQWRGLAVAIGRKTRRRRRGSRAAS